MADLAELGFKVDTGELAKAKTKLDELSPAAKSAETASEKLTNKINELAGGFGSLGKTSSATLGFLGKLAAGFTAALAAVGSIAKYKQLADTWSDLSARAGLAVGSIDAGAEAMQRISDIARGTYSSLENTTEGFINNSRALKALGYSTDQAFNYVEAMNNALVISGAKGERAEGVMRALSKAMATGKLDADGLENVMTNGGKVAELLAQKLGVTTNELRKMTSDGKITGKVIYDSLVGNFDLLKDEAASMPATIADGFQIIENSVLQLVGTFDQYTGISAYVAETLVSIGDAIKFVADNLTPFLAMVSQGVGILGQLASTIGGGIASEFALLLQTISPITGWFNSLWQVVLAFLPSIQDAAIALGILFGPLIIAGIASTVAGIVGLTWSIGVGLVTATWSAVTAMLALAVANPFTAILLAIGLVLAAAYVFRDAISDILGVDVVGAASDGANWIVGAFIGGYNTIKATWSMLPAVIGGIAIAAANNTIAAIGKMVNAAIDGINSLIAALPEWAGGGAGGGIGFRMNDGDTFTNPYAAEIKSFSETASNEFAKAFNTDWVGGFSAAISAATEKVGIATDGVTALGNAAAGGGGAAAGAGGGGGAAKKLTELQKIAEDFGKLSEPFDQAGTAFNAAKSALDNGIITNEQYAASLDKIEAAFMRAGGTSAQWAKVIGQNTDTISSKLEDLAGKALTDLGDEFINLAVDGKANFADLAKSIVKDLLKIMWQALIVKPLLGYFGFGDGGTFGGGKTGSVFGDGGTFGTATQFASGGAFTNSIVNKSTPFTFANGAALGEMGEAGPEAIMPLKRGSDGSLGVQVHGTGNVSSSGGGGNNVNVQVINNANNTQVRQEKTMDGNGDQVQRIIIETVQSGMTSGEFDQAQGARYNVRPAKVIR